MKTSKTTKTAPKKTVSKKTAPKREKLPAVEIFEHPNYAAFPQYTKEYFDQFVPPPPGAPKKPMPTFVDANGVRRRLFPPAGFLGRINDMRAVLK